MFHVPLATRIKQQQKKRKKAEKAIRSPAKAARWHIPSFRRYSVRSPFAQQQRIMPDQPEQQQAAKATPMRITTETRNLRAQLFIPGDDQINTGRAWDDWSEEIEREFRYFRFTGRLDMKDAVIIYGGKEIARLEKSLPDPADE